MTKFILHGGNTRDFNEYNDSFFREMTAESTGKIKILLNYFSRENNEVAQCAEQDKKRILQHSVNKNVDFDIAAPNSMARQLETADVLYIRGGDTEKLVNIMKTIPRFHELLEHKVVAGSSAGVYVLAKYYWENDTDVLGEGLGILNLKARCHYQLQDKEIINKLLDHKERLPLLTLPNYKWVVLFQ